MAEKEYIKRDAALQFVFDACAECMNACEEFDGIYADCNQCMLDGIKLKLRDLPAADAVERKTGKWYGNKRHQRCSLCGITYCVPDGESGEIDMSDYHYCPNCGAVMVWYEWRVDDV